MKLAVKRIILTVRAELCSQRIVIPDADQIIVFHQQKKLVKILMALNEFLHYILR